MTVQLDLLSTLEPVRPPSVPSGQQHQKVLAALLAEGSRGLTGEECALRCGIKKDTSATTRMEEMSKDTKVPHRFPVPLVYKSARKERATASGRLAHVWWLTDAGRAAATELRAA